MFTPSPSPMFAATNVDAGVRKKFGIRETIAKGNYASKDGPLHDRADDVGGPATVKECPECGETYTGEVESHTHKAKTGIRKALGMSHPHQSYPETGSGKMDLESHMISQHGLPNSGNMVGPVENGGPSHSSASALHHLMHRGALHHLMHRGFAEGQMNSLKPYGLGTKPTSFPGGQFPKGGGVVGKVRSLLGKSAADERNGIRKALRTPSIRTFLKSGDAPVRIGNCENCGKPAYYGMNGPMHGQKAAASCPEIKTRYDHAYRHTLPEPDGGVYHHYFSKPPKVNPAAQAQVKDARANRMGHL